MGYMEMPVCESIIWGPVSAKVFGVSYPLQLEAAFLIRSE
jgi:hypothetical protein